MTKAKFKKSSSVKEDNSDDNTFNYSPNRHKLNKYNNILYKMVN